MSIHDKIRPLLARLKAYQVDWKYSFVPTDNVEYEPGIDREETELDKANVVSSELQAGYFGRRHVIALDIDYPAHLIESSTPGHHHLYLDVPNGVDHDDYMFLLSLLARMGVIEKGYSEVSIKRGHSDLRLPWVTKADQKLTTTNVEQAQVTGADHYPACNPGCAGDSHVLVGDFDHYVVGDEVPPL